MKTTLGVINVKKTLTDRSAWFCLNKMWGENLDMLAINEWEDSRRSILASHGKVVTPKTLRSIRYPDSGVVYCDTDGSGLVLGLLAERFMVSRIGRIKLYDGGRVYPAAGQKEVEPTRFALEVWGVDKEKDEDFAALVYHQVAHVEQNGKYRTLHDPRTRMHKQGIEVVEDWFADARRDARPYIFGDDNWHQLKYKGITSSWERRSVPTCGRRDIDNIGSTKMPSSTRQVLTPSDHNGRVSVYA